MMKRWEKKMKDIMRFEWRGYIIKLWRDEHGVYVIRSSLHPDYNTITYTLDMAIQVFDTRIKAVKIFVSQSH